MIFGFSLMMCLCKIDWVAASAIANIVLAVVTVAALVFSIYQNGQLQHQKNEDVRARLAISIIERNGHYQLRISNIGLQTAYNINLIVNKEFLKILDKRYLLGWENIQAKYFNLEKGNSLYLNILPVIDNFDLISFENNDAATLKAKGHRHLAWLKEYGNDVIRIEGTYNGNFKIKQELSLLDYIVLGVDIDENPLVDALNNIGNGISGGGISNTLSERLRPVAEYFRKENMNNRMYGNRPFSHIQHAATNPKDESLWKIIKDYIRRKFK